MKIVLASASPRRRALLAQAGLTDFLTCEPLCDETTPEGAGPEETVRRLSRAKADAVADRYGEDDVVIAADTLVCLDGRLLGKPRDGAEAAEMLARLSGRAHEVYTGLTVRRGARVRTACERTEVVFRPLTAAEIAAYVASGEPMDKAGAYGIQGRGALIVARVQGDFYNVMGLPLCRLGAMLAEFGVSLLEGGR
ncbi:MAG: Maf family protein [Oscillospiraceae bacterium]|jgi:septum formation protein|nr:Maf family protein [Oscillospiraceae bacterium]